MAKIYERLMIVFLRIPFLGRAAESFLLVTESFESSASDFWKKLSSLIKYQK